jgi:hypothetical protein
LLGDGGEEVQRATTFVLLLASPALAQVRVEVEAPPPPTLRFSVPPPLVEVRPGVQVVENADDEVFFSAGYYWHRSPNGVWWRTRDHRGGWVLAPRRSVPRAVTRLPPGQYRHFRAERRELRRERHEIRREIRREERHERRHGRR